MKLRYLVLVLFALGLLIPVSTLAQDTETTAAEDEDVMIRINGDTVVSADQIYGSVVVVNGDIVVEGVIEDTLLLINGVATVNGTVGNELVIVRGTLDLQSAATVDDVMLVRSDLIQDPAATVTGSVEERTFDYSFGRGLAVFSFLWWIGTLIVAVIAAAIFAWLGRRQLYEAIETVRTQIGPSIVTALLIWIVLPIVAVLVAFTIVGIPLTLSIILVLLPILWLLGSIVIGTWIGSYILKPETDGKAIGAAVLGTIIVAIVGLIPFVAFIVALAGMLGSGALVYRIFQRARGERVAPSTPPPTAAPTA
jgi:MFS family permease